MSLGSTMGEPTDTPQPRRGRRWRFLFIGVPAFLILCLGAAGCQALCVSRAIQKAEARRPRDPKTGIRIGAEPFVRDAGEPACLMLHGFAATPQIFHYLAQRFAEEGISCRAPLLPGHGTTIADFATARGPDWVATAEQAYDQMRAQHETVFVLGFSMGGTVALNIAERREVDGLVLMGPFLRITREWFHLVRAESLSRCSRAIGFPRVLKNIRLDIADVSVRPSVIHSGFTPVVTACSLFDLADQTRANIGGLTCPVLVLHGRKDRVADPRESQRLVLLAASRDKRLVLYDRSAHLLPMDYDKEHAAREIIAFIKARTKAGGRRK